MGKLYAFFLSFLVAILLFVGYFHTITAFTQDLGRHLLLGKIILSTHTVPSTNLFSYTYPDFPFLNHHWLSEVLFYLLSSLGGTRALLIATITLVFLAMGMLFVFSYKRTGIITPLISLFLLPVLFERTDIRPEIFSFFLFATTLVILFQNKERPANRIFLLPFIMLLWVNLHIYFFTGIILMGIFFLDALIVNRRNIFCVYNCSLLLVLLLSLIATLANPHFLSGALYPLRTFNNYGYSIEENQTVFFLESLGIHKVSVDFLQLSSIFLFVVLLLNSKRTRLVDWLLSIVFTFAAFIAVRNLPLFSLAVFIPLAINLSTLTSRLIRPRLHASSRRVTLTHLFFILCIGIAVWEIVSTVKRSGFGYREDVGARKATDFFINEHLKGPVLNNFDIGSYLIYRLYPKEKVFVDGRPEAYPAQFFKEEYIPLQEHPEIFMAEEKKYHFNTIFFSHTDQTPWAQTFLQSILQNTSFVPIYLDQTVIILVKDSPENKHIVEQFRMDPKHLHASYDETDLQSLLQLASFFSKLNDQDATFHIAQQILTLSPTNCQALYVRAAIALTKNDLLSQTYASSYEHTCGGKTSIAE